MSKKQKLQEAKAKREALMGKRVRVTKLLRRSVVANRGNIAVHAVQGWKQSLPVNIEGWIVGFRYLQEGFINYGYGRDDPSEWVECGPRTPCVLVAESPWRKPLRVPMDGFEVIES